MSPLKKRKNRVRGVKPDERYYGHRIFQYQGLTTGKLLDEYKMSDMSDITELKSSKTVQRTFSNTSNITHLNDHLLFVKKTAFTGFSNTDHLSLHTHAREENKRRRVAK